MLIISGHVLGIGSLSRFIICWYTIRRVNSWKSGFVLSLHLVTSNSAVKSLFLSRHYLNSKFQSPSLIHHHRKQKFRKMGKHYVHNSFLVRLAEWSMPARKYKGQTYDQSRFIEIFVMLMGPYSGMTNIDMRSCLCIPALW